MDENEGGRRLIALVAVVVLVGIAFVIRGRGDDGGGGSSGGDGKTTLVCPPELATACRAAAGDREVRIEEASVTADALGKARRPADAEDQGDVWLVPRPWVEAVATTRDRANLPAVLSKASGVIARSPVVLVVFDSRAEALEQGPCRTGIAWRCVGDAADEPWSSVGGQATWGTVKAGIARPATSTGLVVLGAATAAYFDDPGFASNDFDGGLTNWLSKLAASSAAADAPRPVDMMLTRGAGQLAALGALEADARSAAGRDDVRVVVPEPVVTADLVAVAIGDPEDADDATDLAGDDDLGEQLAEAGWRVDGEDLADGLDPALKLPTAPGLPRGDVLRVLLDTWQQLL
jgi:hypothetical protein